jgi:deferrochelatase/peroxidase EfeB
MNDAIEFEFDDLQALLRFGHGKLTGTCFMLLKIADAAAARQWLGTAPVSNAGAKSSAPDTALQIAFSVEGLRALGLKESIIEGFSDEFITGMSADESRSRRLGDVGSNAPQHWDWGGQPGQVPHVLLLLYAGKDGIEAWKKTVENQRFSSAFQVLQILPTQDIGGIEPFGFADGISQPEIDWTQRQSTDPHERDSFSNWVAPGEFVLGYLNEYGQYTTRPLIDPQEDRIASLLPNALDNPALKDLGRNGSYLVIRQLHQDVSGFWQFIDKVTGSDPEKREQLAASMVGRQRSGSPLAPLAAKPIPGIAPEDQDNHFTFELDPDGHRCPLGAHIRRANPRTGDFPPGVTGLFTRLLKMLGFGQNRQDEDLIASTRFHRLLRRGRGYGPILSPEDAVKPDAPAAERGLQFIVLVGNISRQFEFVQNAWSMSSTFGGVQQERDPLFGVREPLLHGEATDSFNRPDPNGPMRKTCCLPQFVKVRGGGYFFMPGLRALQFIAASPITEGDNTP